MVSNLLALLVLNFHNLPPTPTLLVAENPYYKRDFRRQYPKTEVVTQGELAKLLIAQGGFESQVSFSSLL